MPGNNWSLWTTHLLTGWEIFEKFACIGHFWIFVMRNIERKWSVTCVNTGGQNCNKGLKIWMHSCLFNSEATIIVGSTKSPHLFSFDSTAKLLSVWKCSPNYFLFDSVTTIIICLIIYQYSRSLSLSPSSSRKMLTF